MFKYQVAIRNAIKAIKTAYGSRVNSYEDKPRPCILTVHFSGENKKYEGHVHAEKDGLHISYTQHNSGTKKKGSVWEGEGFTYAGPAETINTEDSRGRKTKTPTHRDVVEGLRFLYPNTPEWKEWE